MDNVRKFFQNINCFENFKTIKDTVYKRRLYSKSSAKYLHGNVTSVFYDHGTVTVLYFTTRKL